MESRTLPLLQSKLRQEPRQPGNQPLPGGAARRRYVYFGLLIRSLLFSRFDQFSIRHEAFRPFLS